MPRPDLIHSSGLAASFGACIGRALRRFVRSQDGAVTVDWIALSALMIMLALFSTARMQEATSEVGPMISDSVDAAEMDMSGIN